MHRNAPACIGLVAVALSACREAPATLAPDATPAFASVANVHFTEASVSGPAASGYLSGVYKLAGLGSTGATSVSGSANATVVWACQTTTPGEFDIVPAPQSHAGAVSATSNASASRGNAIGTVFIPPPSATLQCLNPRKTLVPLSASYTNVQLTHATAGTVSFPGPYAATFFTVGPEVVPTITNVDFPAATLAIDAAATPYTVTVHNPGSTLPVATVQAWLRQGTNYRAAGGRLVECTATSGELPSGDCTFQGFLLASNGSTIAGQGDLVPGTATLEVQLWIGNSQRTVHAFTIAVTLQ